MAKWNVNRNGPNWLMDAIGRIYGYRDKRGGEYAIPQIAGNWDDAEGSGPSDTSLRILSGVDAGGNVVPPTTPRLQNVTRQIALGKVPVDMVVFGDSTGDETTEWAYLMAQYATSGIAVNHGVAYRLWSDTNQQYSTNGIDYITNGPLGRRYIAAGAATTSHRFELDDSAKTSITGDIDVRVRLNLNGGTFSGAWAAAAKYGGAGQRSWRFEVQAGNTLFFETSNDGTAQIPKTSSVALSGSQLTSDIWIRATRSASTGSVTFYTSPDNSTWTQLGAVQTGSGSAIFDSTTTLQFIGRGAGSISSLGKDVNFYELQVYGSLDGTAMAAWIDCGSVPPRTSATSAAYRDDCGNAGTLYYQASTIGGSPRLCLFNGSVGGQVIAYGVDAGNSNARFGKMAAGGCNVVFINYGHNEAANVTYRTDYKALTDLVVARNVNSAIVGVLQNQRIAPATYINEHEIRIGQVAQFMAEIGGDVLDFFGLVNSSEMKTDGVHPDPALGAGVKMGNAAYALLARNAGRWRIPS